MKKYHKTAEEIIAYNNRIKNGKNAASSPLKKYWNFFPTPQSLIEKMLEDYKDKPLPKNILEPSAGKGDIIEYINQRTSNDNSHPNIYCYELVPELQEILKRKKCQLLGSDFLKHNAQINFDLIIMNPPFDMGVNHLLHAWDILKKGGQIVALLNKHSYYNAYNSHRLKFKTLVDQFGKIQNLGQAFSDNVQRTAQVDVIMVTITKKPDSYYQDVGINLGKYLNPNLAIKNRRAEYVVRELPKYRQKTFN